MILTPDHGASRLQEYNHFHQPGGSPAGGQFSSAPDGGSGGGPDSHGALHNALMSAVTAYDRRREGKPGFNRYALPQYMQAVDNIITDVKSGKPLLQAIGDHTNDLLKHALIKAAGTAVDLAGDYAMRYAHNALAKAELGTAVTLDKLPIGTATTLDKLPTGKAVNLNAGPAMHNGVALTPEHLGTQSLSDLGYIAQRDWNRPRSAKAGAVSRGVNYAAKPYLDALRSMDKIGDNYGQDSGHEIVARFLGNATSWRGPVAKAVKAELNKRLKGK